MLGLGHAILTGEPLIGNEPFAVILADDLCDCDSQGVIAQMIDVYEKNKCSIIAVEEISVPIQLIPSLFKSDVMCP